MRESVIAIYENPYSSGWKLRGYVTTVEEAETYIKKNTSEYVKFKYEPIYKLY